MSINVSALQLLPEIGLQPNSFAGRLPKTCADPTCIITYCSVPNTTIG